MVVSFGYININNCYYKSRIGNRLIRSSFFRQLEASVLSEDVINKRLKYTILLLYLFVVIVAVTAGVDLFLVDPSSPSIRFVVYGLYTIFLMVIGAVLGATSKTSTSKIGVWERETRLVSIHEYETIAAKYKEDFRKLFSDFSDASGCCCTMMIPLIMLLAFASITSEEMPPEYWFTIGALLVIPIAYILFGIISYLIGYYSVKSTVSGFFTPPDDEALSFALDLSQEELLDVRALIEIGVRGEKTALFSTEWRIFVEGLPETVYMKLQVDEGFFYPYPYLVGIIEDGPYLDERTEDLELDTRFPAAIEYSTDDRVSVLVSRFDKVSVTSELKYEPNIEGHELRKLGLALAERLRANYMM